MPVKWDVKLIEQFMLVFGPVSSVFDFLTFYALLHLFGAGEALFQTGWFIEFDDDPGAGGLCYPYAAAVLPKQAAAGSSSPWRLGAVAVAIVLPLLPVGRWFGFVAPPPLFFVYLVGATIAYLALVEVTKAHFLPRHVRPLTAVHYGNRSRMI